MLTREEPSTTSPLLAVFFDMDGTLIQSGGVWDDILRELASSRGHTLPPDYFKAIVGETSAAAVALARQCFGEQSVTGHGGVKARTGRLPAPDDPGLAEDVRWVRARALELLGQSTSTWSPNARRLVADCRASGLRVALVTSSERIFVQAQLNAEERSWFDLIVTLDDVESPKPAPDPYLAAARLLGVPPENCVVVEDSLHGVTSALAAGCSIAVVRPGLRSVADGQRYREFDGLSRLTVRVLRKIHSDS